MELITLGNGVQVVEVDREEAASYDDELAEAIEAQIGVVVDVTLEVVSDGGRLRYCVVSA